MPTTQFISEPIKPVIATCDTNRMSISAPGLPKEFIWRGEKVIVTEILRSWRAKPALAATAAANNMHVNTGLRSKLRIMEQ